MELRHLKYFMAVAETLHFGKAAKKLFITQPPLSRQIKQLEIELGVELFTRNTKQVLLTEPGKYLVTESQKLFDQINMIKKSLQRISNGFIGTITIGYIGSSMDSILPVILKILKNQYKDINTTLVDMISTEQVDALKDGDIDVGFVRMPIDTRDLIVKKIHSEKFALVTPLNYNVKGSEKKALRSLSTKPFISFSQHCGSALINSIQNICNQCGFFPNTIHETRQISTIIKLVDSGLGYSIVPSSTKNSFNLKVKFLDLNSFKETSDISIAYKKDFQNPIVNNLLKIINNLP